MVVGGGPTGCELAQAFARLGSVVALVEAGDRLLYVCCMPKATRTQVYFTPELRDRIDARAAAEGKTMAEVVREAAGVYLAGDGLVVRLPSHLRAQLDELATSSQRTVEQIVVDALESHLAGCPNGAAVRAALEEFTGSDPEFSIPARADGAHRDPWA